LEEMLQKIADKIIEYSEDMKWVFHQEPEIEKWLKNQ
jgi:hypothetical protein